MYPIIRVFAIMLAFAIAGTALAGPFGYNAGDEMPPAEGTNPIGLDVAEVPAPAGFDGLVVFGTEKTGICGVSVVRVIEQGANNPDTVDMAVQQLENVLSREYGSYIMSEDSDVMMWVVEDDDSDVFGISLSTRTWTALDAGIAADHVLIEIHYELTNKGECVAEANAGLTAADGNARAEDFEDTAAFGDNRFHDCENWTNYDAFDGKSAGALCGDYSTPITTEILMHCQDNTTYLSIQFTKYMLEDGLRLRTALDGVETPQWRWNMADWDTAPDNEFVVLDIEPEIPMIENLLDHSRLQIRVIEKNGYTHNADIDISGLGEAIKPVRELCGW